MQDGTTLPIPDDQPTSEILQRNHANFAPGTVLGGTYRLIRRLGGGGMGDIHLASHERLPGLFVVKVLGSELLDDEESFVRFSQEATVMAKIRHPNVVHLVDFNFTPTGLPYLVMDYLPGKDLAEILTVRPFLPPARVCNIVRQVACAMDATHRVGIVHRDLKPENIMVVPCEGQDDLVMVIDFGISKGHRAPDSTGVNRLIGTPEFMSPEQAEGLNETVGASSDQFALAVITYLLLSGRTPWGTSEPLAILDRVVNGDPMPLSREGTLPAVQSVLFRAMARLPADRYPTMLFYWRALERAMKDDGLLLADRESAPPPPTVVDEPVDEPVVCPSVGQPAVVAVVAASAADAPIDGGPVLETPAAAPVPEYPPITTRVRRARRDGWNTAALLFVLACGIGLGVGLLDAPARRARAVGAWNALRGGVVAAAARVFAVGHVISKPSSRDGKANLSLESGESGL